MIPKKNNPPLKYTPERVEIIRQMAANLEFSRQQIVDAVNAVPGPVITGDQMSKWMIKKEIFRPAKPPEELIRTPERIALAMSLRAENMPHGQILPLVNALPGAQITVRQLTSMVSYVKFEERMKAGPVVHDTPPVGLQTAQPINAPSIRASLSAVTAWAEQAGLPEDDSIEQINEARALRGLPAFEIAGAGPAVVEWTDKQEEELRRLWPTGASTAQIGKAIGVTKNAIIGKAHRLGLPGRESPIRISLPDRPQASTIADAINIRTLPLMISELAALRDGLPYDFALPFWWTPECLSLEDITP